MTGFGESLRAERERRGLSLAEVCARTKVSERQLAALEAERYGELPAGVFRRGIVRAYLDALGLDAEEWMPRFQESCDAVLGPELEISPEALRTFAENVKRTRSSAMQRNSFRWLGVLCLFLSLCAAAWAVWRYLLHGKLR